MTEGQGGITDDTQMKLFTAEGLIRAVVRGLARGICAPEGVVHHAPLRWHRTQGGVPRMEIRDRDLAQCHGLARHPATPRRRCRNLSADTAPMLVGQYKMVGTPHVSGNAASIEYPEALCAYLWEGDRELDADRLKRI